MPLYEYECGRCGRFEKIRSFSDPPLAACPTCQGEIERLASAPAIQFKGSGWYITDYARKGNGGTKDASQGDGKGSEPAKTGGSSPAPGSSSTSGSTSTPSGSSSGSSSTSGSKS